MPNEPSDDNPFEGEDKPGVPGPGGEGKGRPRAAKTAPVGAGRVETPRKHEFKAKDADLLWGEVLAYMDQIARDKHELCLFFYRAEGHNVCVGWCDVNEVLGDGTNMGPDLALREYMIDKIHLPARLPRQVLYWVQFRWKRLGEILTSGTILLPSPHEIMAQRAARAQQSNYGGAPQGYMPPPFGGQPSMPFIPPPQQPPPQPTPPPGYHDQSPAPGAGSPPIGAGSDPQLMQLTQWALGEMMMAMRERREPSPLAQQVAAASAPPPAAPGVGSEISEERIVEKLYAKIAPMLAHAAPPPAPVAPPPTVAAPPPAPVNPFAAMTERLAAAALRRAERELTDAISGVGAPPRETEEEEDDRETTAGVGAPPGEVADPKADLPYRLVPHGTQWPDGSPVMVAPRKDGGGIMGNDPMGLALGNTWLLSKFGEGAMQLAATGLKIAEKLATPQPMRPGVGAPPTVTVQQPQAAPAPHQELPAPPAPAPAPSPPVHQNGHAPSPVPFMPGGYPQA